jgi:hypothetical protein
MDPQIIAAMLFTLIILAMIGGFILLLPITRRLGAILEQRLNGRAAADIAPAEARQLEATIQALRADLEQLSERQAFTEALLSERQPRLLPVDESPRDVRSIE